MFQNETYKTVKSYFEIMSKKLKYVLVVIILAFCVWMAVLYSGLSAIGDALDSMTATTIETQDSIELQGSNYTLIIINGGAFTSREWIVKKDNQIILSLNSHDGVPERFAFEDGQLYLVGEKYRARLE